MARSRTRSVYSSLAVDVARPDQRRWSGLTSKAPTREVLVPLGFDVLVEQHLLAGGVRPPAGRRQWIG